MARKLIVKIFLKIKKEGKEMVLAN